VIINLYVVYFLIILNIILVDTDGKTSIGTLEYGVFKMGDLIAMSNTYI